MSVPAIYNESALANIDIVNGSVEIKTLLDLVEYSKFLLASGFCPKELNSPSAVGIAVSKGRELGLGDLAAVQSIAVINGRPALWGDAVPGLCMATRELEEFEELFEGNFGNDDFTAICIARRKGLETRTEKFSVADAKTAGLWGRNTWKGYPKRMLQMRARGFCFRSLFPDVLMGMWLMEELQGTDIDPKKDEPAGFESHLESLKLAKTYHDFKNEYNFMRDTRKSWPNTYNRQVEDLKAARATELKDGARVFVKLRIDEHGLATVLATLKDAFGCQYEPGVFERGLEKHMGVKTIPEALGIEDLDTILDAVTKLYIAQKEQGIVIEEAIDAEVVESVS